MKRLADSTDTPLRRRLYSREAELLRGWEGEHLAEFDLCLGVSEGDTRWFAEMGQTRRVYQWSRSSSAAAVARLLGCEQPLKLLFVGNGAWEPNRIGMAWFVRDVIPAVVACAPSAHRSWF